jgi:hypothetical protein
MSGTPRAPVFEIVPAGGMASRMVQYMVALAFQRLVPACRIAGIALPAWGIDHPPIDSPGPVEPASQHQHIDLAGLAERVRTGAIHRVVFSGLGQRMENFLDVAACRAVFPAQPPPIPVDDRHLLCPIGVADAPEEHGPFHPLTPIEFYRQVVAESGLLPMFVGSNVPRPYLERLQAAFPAAPFLLGATAMQDFAMIRHARNIAVGVSLHAWLAAWLSQADRIFMAVSGQFNPMQYPFVDLLPIGDARYLFHLFPINYDVPPECHAIAHRRLAPFIRPVAHAVLQRRRQEVGRYDPTNDEILANFDAGFYLAANPDVARLLGAGNVEGARAHYLLLGVKEQRLPLPLAPTWYAARYPMAACEVAQGDYTNFAHHYIAVGRDRGYRPLPPSADSRSWWEDDGADGVARNVSGEAIRVTSERA